ncbi:hypothetical protein MHLP_02745 [Candidatus Mycoplasma haematolamae str. Purdue]|uniref:Uncharacterized protein n=1 Tax=Mycoplasma haematolamae (strain Purdue) TaxID=1212765 RepID=I7CJT4_MYCHA|nr:hypothetical protein [Candidatus Mycoplasma haematolamae]AFO52129.1 hypothetical protein MHLP_02745 [Candidatus Mycoplasma haematolamae str. Purdue]
MSFAAAKVLLSIGALGGGGYAAKEFGIIQQVGELTGLMKPYRAEVHRVKYKPSEATCDEADFTGEIKNRCMPGVRNID